MKRIPRPARCKQNAACELTEQGHIAALTTTSIEYTLTRRGQGYYLPTQGKFLMGEDDRRHVFSFEESSLGGHVSALTLLTRYAEAYADSDEEWEALTGSRLDTILKLRAHLSSRSLAV